MTLTAMAVLAAVAMVTGATPASPATAAGRRAAAEPPPPTVPRPFGDLTCVPKYTIRFCPGGQIDGRDLRVRSFDGVPLDADVALPATGRGPFPLIVLLHGLGESKAEWEVTADDGGIDDVTLADQGYAVLMYTARGFGDSCGTAASRVDTPGCAKGWIELADQRYEIRDTDYLAGLLVDEGLVKPDFAVAGLSYGGGQSLELAALKNRMRLPDGRLVPMVSPKRHIPMAVAAAYAMWPWDDLDTALVPNGHLSSDSYTPAADDRSPVGVAKESWDKLLYGVTAGAYLAPPGVNPQADLTTWEKESLAGEPYTAAESQALRIMQTYKSAIGVPPAPGGPAPTAIQNGWTDSLFPASEGLHYALSTVVHHEQAHLLLMFDDVGHGWAQDKAADIAYTDAQGIAFLDSVMLHHRLPPSRVVAIPQTCPITAPSGPALTRLGRTLAVLQHGSVTLGGTAPQTVTSSGGSPAVAAALNPAYAGLPLCHNLPAAPEPGTALYRSTVTRPVQLLGAVSVTAHIAVHGRYPELVARLWDVAPGGATRQIVAMGVYRPSVVGGTVTFELNPNDYTFAAGHTIELELVGSNAPYFRASNGTFTVTVRDLRASLPTAV